MRAGENPRSENLQVSRSLWHSRPSHSNVMLMYKLAVCFTCIQFASADEMRVRIHRMPILLWKQTKIISGVRNFGTRTGQVPVAQKPLLYQLSHLTSKNPKFRFISNIIFICTRHTLWIWSLLYNTNFCSANDKGRKFACERGHKAKGMCVKIHSLCVLAVLSGR